jgi:hypothetical protein
VFGLLLGVFLLASAATPDGRFHDYLDSQGFGFPFACLFLGIAWAEFIRYREESIPHSPQLLECDSPTERTLDLDLANAAT